MGSIRFTKYKYEYLLIKIKKQVFDKAIRNDKEFSEVKKIYLELKELEKELENYIEKSQKQFACRQNRAGQRLLQAVHRARRHQRLDKETRQRGLSSGY